LILADGFVPVKASVLVTRGRGQIALKYQSGEQEPRLPQSKVAPAQAPLAPTRQNGEGMGNLEANHHATAHIQPSAMAFPAAGSPRAQGPAAYSRKV